jgi:hypothetical protein
MSTNKSILKLGHDAPEVLFTACVAFQYSVVGPTVRNGAIVYDELASPSQLPRGYSDDQDAGLYRVTRNNHGVWFDYTVGPHSWKKYLFPPQIRLWQVRTNEKQLTFSSEPSENGQDRKRCALFWCRAGMILTAKIVPPTSQNQKTIEDDLRRYVSTHSDLPQKQLT